MDKITVVAMQGCICPRERLGEPVITDCEPVTVKQTPFYTRLLADGSLRMYQPPKSPARKAEKSEKTEKTGGNK